MSEVPVSFIVHNLDHQRHIFKARLLGVLLQCFHFSLLPGSYELNSSLPPCALCPTNSPLLHARSNEAREPWTAVSAAVSYSKPLLT